MTEPLITEPGVICDRCRGSGRHTNQFCGCTGKCSRCDGSGRLVPATTEPTVEECLKELREMLPNCTAEIVSTDAMGFYKPPTHRVEVAFISTDYMINERFHGPTLSECMAQVRAHFQEQEK